MISAYSFEFFLLVLNTSIRLKGQVATKIKKALANIYYFVKRIV